MAREGEGVLGVRDGDFPAATLPYRDMRIAAADEKT